MRLAAHPGVILLGRRAGEAAAGRRLDGDGCGCDGRGAGCGAVPAARRSAPAGLANDRMVTSAGIAPVPVGAAAFLGPLVGGAPASRGGTDGLAAGGTTGMGPVARRSSAAAARKERIWSSVTSG